jgi:hypothetical protein
LEHIISTKTDKDLRKLEKRIHDLRLERVQNLVKKYETSFKELVEIGFKYDIKVGINDVYLRLFEPYNDAKAFRMYLMIDSSNIGRFYGKRVGYLGNFYDSLEEMIKYSEKCMGILFTYEIKMLIENYFKDLIKTGWLNFSNTDTRNYDANVYSGVSDA